MRHKIKKKFKLKLVLIGFLMTFDYTLFSNLSTFVIVCQYVLVTMN